LKEVGSFHKARENLVLLLQAHARLAMENLAANRLTFTSDV